MTFFSSNKQKKDSIMQMLCEKKKSLDFLTGPVARCEQSKLHICLDYVVETSWLAARLESMSR